MDIGRQWHADLAFNGNKHLPVSFFTKIRLVGKGQHKPFEV
jgi:hypothetical protein